jgi:AcrR family transcriptional regulator
MPESSTHPSRHLALVRSPELSAEPEFKGKRAVTRHRLMNACSTIIVRSGFKAVSMTAIAEEAGITRQTVYRYFANASDVISATIMRAGREVLEAQYLAYREEGEPKDLIVTAVMTSLRLITHNVLLVKALTSGGNPRLLFAASLDESITGRSVDELRRIGDEVGWDEQECREVNEIIIRTVNSYLMMPARDQRESSIRADLYKRLIPALGL